MAKLKEEWMSVTRAALQCIVKVPCRVKTGTGKANITMIQAQRLAAWAAYREQETGD